MNRISEANAADHERDILLDEIESTFYGNVDALAKSVPQVKGNKIVLWSF